ncbi:zinc finger protein 318-like isoform X2 [Haliotis rubra]|uniref:zinc finger protein 318-like isoform X2 n=1 Tax=Haliotis rubra TaxID=36100 RepID=UPI001EE6232B|nr:zinc finger protein 318-like isoform X2 [Haliotis rubra]
MAFISRSRSRNRPMLIRGRGKFFRGRGSVGNRGEGLRITLNNRADGGESGVQRSSRGRGSIHKQDRHSRDRRENPDYVGNDSRDMREKSAERKRHDHYEFRRGDVSPSMRRSHDKIDLAADAESLRITVGNEKFFKERVDESPRRVTPLSERLGPPVDMTEPLDGPTRQRDYGQRGRYSNDRFDCEKEKTYWLHEETQRSEKYKRCDERQLNRYSKRTPVDDSPYDKARKTGSKDHDWKNSHDEYSDSCQDPQRANVRHYRFEQRNMDSDTVHRRSGDRYEKDDFRCGKRKYDRYKDYDDSRKVPFSPEMKRDDFNKSYQSDRRRESVDSFENYDHDVNVNEYKHDVERKKFHIHEMSNRVASHREIESSMHSPNSEKRSPRIEREKRGGLVEQIDNELSSSRIDSVIQHQSEAPSVATKPLKSILKKRSDSASGYDAGTQGGVAEQVSDFLKQFQAPLPSDDLVSVASGRASLEMQVNASLQSNTNVPGCVQNEMNVDDEERFLYGDAEINAAITKAHQSQALFPVLDKEVTKSQIIQEHNSANPKMMFDPSSCIPSWMKPQPSIEPGSTEENKGEDMDKTVQNILKSIGFNFDLSKRMQELAKLKKQKEEESHFSINKNASFLGGGISSADIRAKLFKKEDAGTPVESFVKEAKETVKHSDKGYQDYPVDHQRNEPLVVTHQDQNEKFRDIDLIHQPTAPASQQTTPVSHFQPPPMQYPSFYSGMYHSAYGQQAGHPSLVPPGNPHAHLPPTYSYASPYTCAQHSYSTPVSHLAQSYSSHMSPSPEIGSLKPRRPASSANLTIVPIADDEKKPKLTAPEVTKKTMKREREKSPEYSRIVIAPKSKSKDERSPAQKILKVKRESTKDKSKKPNSDNKLSDTILHKEKAQLSKPMLQEQKDEVKPSTLSTSEKQSLLKECEDRKKKLQVLEKELGKLKKHQNEIMRRRQRQRDGHKDPLLVQNSKLQEEITIQIRHLRKASEKSAFVLKQADKEDQNNLTAARKDVDDPFQVDTKTEKNVGIKYEFYDPGGHWCGVCHHVSASLFDHFTHLQAKKHKQKCDPYDRPWLTDITQNTDKRQEKAATVEVKAMKGVEFMMSTDAFYCSLCHIFSGDVTSAELHIKSEEHFAKYENHLQQNEFYEKRYTLEKTAFLSQVKEEEKKNGEKEKVRKCKSLQGEIDEVPHVVENLPSYKSNLDSHDEERKQEVNETPISQKHKRICEDKAKPQKEEIPADSKQEDTTKGKIAIKLTGKTGIKPQPRILPPWTPVTKKELFRTKNKAEALPVKKGITKSESVQPASLDMFLTIGGPTTKKLPVYKLRSGTVKKPCNIRAKSPDEIKNQEGEKLSDMKSDMKLLGIEEDMSTPIAAKKPPPPRSQNLSLPKDPSSNSSSSAEELYSVFYHDSACTARDCASNINLDDIPIPPPPPQPSIITPDSEETKAKDTEKPIENKVMSSDMIIRSKALVVDTENNCTNTDLVETPLALTHGINVAEGGCEQDCKNLNTATLKDAVKIDSSIVVGDDDKERQEKIFLSVEVEGVAGCKNDMEKSSDISDETKEKQHLMVNENENVSELSVARGNEDESTLPRKESTLNEKTKVSADLQTDSGITDSQEETSGQSCHLDDVIPVVGQDFEEEMEMAAEVPTIDLIDNSHIYPVDPAGVSSKAPGSNTVTDNEDIGSNESCESMHMDSDFEVLDEYEAD